MKVSRWGHALAVRLPAALVNDLGLVEGDEITLVPRRPGTLDIAYAERHTRAAEHLRERQEEPIDYLELMEIVESVRREAQNGPLPPDPA
ncbi:AbrB/MazE/SpoVT family DNA-binding domain-containing protein [Acidobacteria bacterium AB60]|nr:AbrB/MazE/SpoVT family DNA-binding domain-containing protein [Acidobacteria bacterium AB60]